MPPKRASKKPAEAPTRSSRTSASFDDRSGVASEDDVDMDERTDMARELRIMEENLKRSMAVDVGLRKGQKQQRLEKEFEAQVKAIEAQIDDNVRKYQEEAKRIQAAYLARLTTLLQRKAEVEKQIVQHTQELAEQYLATKEEFKAVLRGRSEDVHEVIEELKSVAGDASPQASAQ